MQSLTPILRERAFAEPPSFIQFDSSFEAFRAQERGECFSLSLPTQSNTKRRKVIFSLVVQRREGFAILAACVCVRWYGCGTPLVFASSRFPSRAPAYFARASIHDAVICSRGMLALCAVSNVLQAAIPIYIYAIRILY